MIEKEEWLSRHKGASEKEWKAFKQYCLDCGFKSEKINGQEVIFGKKDEAEEGETNG